MSHVIHIDHRRREHRLTAERAPGGRIASEAETIAEDMPAKLAHALSGAIDGEVRFDNGSRALYATDASNYRQVPIGVVIPRSIDDVVETVALCKEYDAPLVMRGGGTSLAGQGCNVAVLVDFSKYLHHMLSLEPERKLATVEPGCVLDDLRDAAEKHHLTFGPDPATHDHNTLGGMLGNNSCGVHSIMSGRTSDNVESLDILTYDGLQMTVGPTSDEQFQDILADGGRRAEIYRALDEFRNRYGDMIRARFPKIPRRVSGYENLDELLPEKGFNVARALVGTEGTCVTILRATLNLSPSPPERVLAILGFADVFSAADAVPEVLTYKPIGLEGIDDMLIDFVRVKHLHPTDITLLPKGNGWLVAEFGADTADAAAEMAGKLIETFREKGCGTALLRDKSKQQQIWELREAALAATAHVPDMPEAWPGWEDSAVPREALGNYLRDLKALFRKYGYKASVYGHFGDGLVHCRIPFNLRTEDGVAAWRRFLDEAADLVVRYGGSLSGEHGDGEARGALLEKMYGPELIQAFREFKAIWDPDGRMNPGKVVDPFPITANLRVGPLYHPEEPQHYFAYREDGGSYAKAMQRCVGVGSCRREDSARGVMCPSYMVTREERHSTRGRARMLFEMLHGGPLKDGWNSPEVEEALDLCLACKGCKRDCPVHVDMATYKAEFRAHYYAGRLRPRSAYSMGLIHRWARMASHVPALANGVLQAPGLGTAAKWVGGIDQRRSMPRFADVSFTDWFRNQPRQAGKRGRVMLWPDTFNNYFRTRTAKAAMKVLQKLGYEVVIPGTPLCCGRPLYDWGMLDAAKRLWRTALATLEAEIEAGTPVIGLEPACVSAFRDELPGLFPDAPEARRLSGQTLFLSEFLDRHCDEIGKDRLGGDALVQLHCHHHAVLDAGAERRVLDALGVNSEVMASGCCGMAGSFGFEVGKYELSLASAERVLFPRLRAAPQDVSVVANGFSCREQIEQGTGRSTMHVAEMLAGALVPGWRNAKE